MPNAVSLNAAGIIEQDYEGDQTDESLATVMAETQIHVTALRQAGQPVNILVNVTQLGKVTTETRKLAVQTLMHLHYDHIALFGTTTYTKALINLIAYAAGKTQQVRIFKSQPLAMQWLGTYAKA